MAKRKAPVVGDQIKLTADHLRATGQILGNAGSRRWTVVDCVCGLCSSGRFVATNEESIDGGPRHFNVANVQRVGELVVDRLPQAGFLKLHLEVE